MSEMSSWPCTRNLSHLYHSDTVTQNSEFILCSRLSKLIACVLAWGYVYVCLSVMRTCGVVRSRRQRCFIVTQLSKQIYFNKMENNIKNLTNHRDVTWETSVVTSAAQLPPTCRIVHVNCTSSRQVQPSKWCKGQTNPRNITRSDIVLLNPNMTKITTFSHSSRCCSQPLQLYYTIKWFRIHLLNKFCDSHLACLHYFNPSKA
jgi:hypothetical protein